MHLSSGGRLAALCVALAPAPAMAQVTDTQVWSTVTVAGALGPGLNGQWENSYRLRDGADQWLTRGSVDLGLGKGFSAGVGLAYVHDASGGDVRPHQQVGYASGRLALRTRLEEQFFPGPRHTQFRLRQRAAYALPLAPGLRASMTAELLYTVRRGIASAARRDQWRAGASLVRKIAPGLDASAGYLAIYAPRTGPADRLSHVAQFGLIFRP